MVSRVGWIVPGLVCVALGAADPAQAQSNLDAGKTPAQIFSDTCNACHRSPRELRPTSSGLFAGTLYRRRPRGRGHGRLCGIGRQRPARGPAAAATGPGRRPAIRRRRRQPAAPANPEPRAIGQAPPPEGIPRPDRGAAGRAGGVAVNEPRRCTGALSRRRTNGPRRDPRRPVGQLEAATALERRCHRRPRRLRLNRIPVRPPLEPFEE